MDAVPGVCDTARMSAAANTVLLAATVAFFVAVYRLGWAVVADLTTVAPSRRAAVPRLRRVYHLSVLLAFVSAAAMAAHLAVRDVFDMGVGASQAALWAGAALLAVALWCVAASRAGQ